MEEYQDGKIIVPYDFEQLLELFEAADFSVPHTDIFVEAGFKIEFMREIDLQLNFVNSCGIM